MRSIDVSLLLASNDVEQTFELLVILDTTTLI